jgi:uncharacterized protein DUF5666
MVRGQAGQGCLDTRVSQLLAFLGREGSALVGAKHDFMKLQNLFLLVLLGFTVGVSNSRAQTEPAKPGEPRFGNPTSTARVFQDYVYGVIKGIDKEGLIVDKTFFGDGQNFKLDRKTKFIHDGKGRTLADLKVGDKVWIDVKVDKKTGQMTARKVVTGVGPTELK